jgi:hypothetical protein
MRPGVLKELISEMKYPKSRLVLAFGLTVTLLLLAWELAFDINDPTIPLIREFLFTAGSTLGICAYLYCLLERE